MNIPVFIWLLILVFYLSSHKNEYDRSTIIRFVKFGCLLLILESGLRHISVGPDTRQYYSSFYSVMEMDWSTVLAGLFVDKTEFRDPGYDILVKAFATIIPSWQIFIFAGASLYYYSLGRLMSKYCSSCTSAFLGFTLILALFNIIALSGLRQMITMALSMLVIESIMDKKWNKCIIFTIVGSLLHISFLFTLLFIPFVYIKGSFQHTIHLISLFVFPLIGIFSRNVVSYLASFSANDYYMNYAEKTNEVVGYTFTVIVFLLSLFIYIRHKSIETQSDDNVSNAKFLQPAAILMTLSAPLILQDGAMIRICQVFSIYLVITIGNIVDCSRNKKLEYILMFVFLCFYIFRTKTEYYFFWQSVPDYIYRHPFWGW